MDRNFREKDPIAFPCVESVGRKSFNFPIGINYGEKYPITFPMGRNYGDKYPTTFLWVVAMGRIIL